MKITAGLNAISMPLRPLRPSGDAEPDNNRRADNVLLGHLMDLGAGVEAMMDMTLRAMTRRDTALAAQIFQRDRAVDAMRISLDRLAVSALKDTVNGQPLSVRRCIATVKIAGELERIGDLCKGIARRIDALPIAHMPVQMDTIDRMGQRVRRQLSEVLDTLAKESTASAMQSWINDQDIDELYVALVSELLTYMAQDRRYISSGTALLFMTKNLERIGDHVTHIAESIYYSVKGTPLTDDRTIRDQIER